MTKPKYSFHKYARELSEYADAIDVKEATSTERVGKLGARDVFVFWRNTYSEGNYYLGMFKDILYLFALMPLALATIGLPTNFAIMVAMIYIFSSSLIGFISYRFLALPRRETEMSELMSMNRYQVWDLLKQIQTEQVRQRPKRRKKK